MNPRISIVAPVRGRVPQLSRMLLSLVKTAADVDSVEIILRCDVDDKPMIHYLSHAAERLELGERGGELRFIVGPRLYGYRSLAKFINEAGRLSRGDLIFVLNDDAEFVTTGWDDLLVEAAAIYEDGLVVLGVDTVFNASHFPFPVIPRRTMEVLGFVKDERLVYTDIWLRDTMRCIDRAVPALNVQVAHRWEGMTEDQASAELTTRSVEYHELYNQCVVEAVKKLRAAQEAHSVSH